MIQTENPTQTVVRTRAEPTRRNTERVGKIGLNMGSGCGVGVHFSRLASTGCSLSADLVVVQTLVRRNQHIGHAFGQLHIQ